MIVRRAVLALGVAFVGAPAFGGTLGTLSLTVGDTVQSLVITDEFSGVETWWNTGGVSIRVRGQNGGSVQLTFTENGPGPAEGPHITIVGGNGAEWQDVSGTMRVLLERADNRPPQYALTGTFSGQLEPVAGGTSLPFSGRFEALLPRQDFAPTPGPGEVPGN